MVYTSYPILPELSLQILAFLAVLMIWESLWKGIGLWKSGRNNQLVWFIFIFIFNTVGILPIIYLAFFQAGKKKEAILSKSVPKKSVVKKSKR
jgi:hypothetical protein